MTADEIRALFARRDEAWALRDSVALAAAYARDCVLESPTAGAVIGREAIEKVYRVWVDGFPDLKVETEELLIAGDRVVQMASVSGTNTGGFLGLPPTGKPFRVRGVFLFELKADLFVRERRILDFSGILLQLAGQVGTVNEGSRLYRDTLARAKLENDMRIAAEIQRALLPEKRHAGTHFEIVAASAPCRAIGGDFFDYFDLTNGAFGFALGDVAGKGPPAALLAAVLQGMLAAHVHVGGAPADIVKRVNESLVRRAVESRFATIVYGMLLSDGRLTYCNAGHNPPLLVGRQGVQRLEKGGLIVGAFEHMTFEEQTLQLDPGDTLVAFSDGLSEALNTDDQEFGEERLLSCVQANYESSPTDLLQYLLDTVRRFTAAAEQSDDLTLLVLRYWGAPVRA